MMKISVKVQTRAKVEKVEELSPGSFKVWVHASPANNVANKAVIKILAGHFDVAKSGVSITSGATSRNKIITIESLAN